jgi:uroporphyrin-3 C-methyltransferase
MLALALAFFAAAAAGSLWWQYRQFYVTLDAADGDNAASLREVRVMTRALEDELAELGEQRQEMVAAIASIVEQINALPVRFSNLEARLAAAQGVSTDARERWLRAQADYYLNVARTELTLRRNRSGAMAALELADQTLLEAGSPVFADVRTAIAGELIALRGLRVPDVDGLSYSLNRLAGLVTDLPMRAAAAGGAGGAGTDEVGEPGLARLWLSLKNALTGMVRIERSDPAEVYSLPPDEQLLVRRRVELELTLGRLGLAQSMPEVFAASLGTAKLLLEQHFDTQDASVEGAITLLEEMLRLDVAQRYPDISGSLALLRNLPDRDG